MDKFEHQMIMLAIHSVTNEHTLYNNTRIARQICKNLRSLNIQCRRVEQLKIRHVEACIHHRLSQGIALRTLHNEMSVLRKILKQAGRHQMINHERFSNDALGLSGADRSSPRTAISSGYFRIILDEARIKDPGFAVSLELARHLGLSPAEAAQCLASLKEWHQAYRYREKLDRRITELRVMPQPRHNVSRYALVLDHDAVKEVIDRGLAIVKTHHGMLVNIRDAGKAKKYWAKLANSVGLTGENSPRSLRYAWVREAIQHFLDRGFSKHETLTMISMSLGHGSGNYVRRVYGKMADLSGKCATG
ncbi:integrase domain-containing protein [Salmonella enterica]|nr:DNA-binding protein [Salmonella enterica subsp. enterica]EJH7016006.1 integrase domain-containing protein [Salmonella enterica]EIZ8586826.1 integrase domain-containing protein [Salmonella enterica subsp. enterica]EJH7441375.1 integrase domain-containing protein [Salmonella enterica]EJH7880798.1 integrase domain-containing protein [Salmonella enterica]